MFFINRSLNFILHLFYTLGYSIFSKNDQIAALYCSLPLTLPVSLSLSSPSGLSSPAYVASLPASLLLFRPVLSFIRCLSHPVLSPLQACPLPLTLPVSSCPFPSLQACHPLLTLHVSSCPSPPLLFSPFLLVCIFMSVE